MSKQRIAVTWEMYGYIEVEADSIEEAMNKVRKNPDNYHMPYDCGEYVDGSFCLTTNDVDTMKAICGTDTNDLSKLKRKNAENSERSY